MFRSLCLCCLISVTILGGTPVFCNEDEYEVDVTITSLTRSDEPFLYIESLCGDQNASQCRQFKCSVYSAADKTDIYWTFKTCSDEKCDFKPKESNASTVDGLQVSANITLDQSDSGILRCFANNSHGHIEDSKEVVPGNNTGQRYIKLTEQNPTYEILPDSRAVRVSWTLIVDGHPPPTLSLLPNNKTLSSFSDKYQDFDNKTNQKISVVIRDISTEDLNTKYYLYAENKFERKIFNLTFNISKLHSDGIAVQDLNENYSTVKCSAKSVLPCNISWSMKNSSDSIYMPVSNTNTTNTDLQCVSDLRIPSSSSGFLRCDVKNSFDSKTLYEEFNSVPGIIDIFSDNYLLSHVDETTKRVEVEISEALVLKCRVSAFKYTNEIQWTFKNLDNNINDVRIKMENENTLLTYQNTMTISPLGPTLAGKYFCKTRLKNGETDYKAVDVTLAGMSNWPYYIIIFLVVIVVGISVFIGLKMRTYQRIQKEMKELSSVGLDNFEKGALEHLNPNLTIDDQADLLPYDKRYELPIERLKLGEQIGSGAFGVVVKAEVSGIFENESSTTVAVKMVNRTIGDIYIKALASELKIMIHLGKHVNIVNLLGACTKNITKRELLVIAEYCRFGNLKDYLLNQRHTFVDQINPETGKIDLTIGGDALGVNKPELTYVTPCVSNRFYEATTIKSILKEEDNKNILPETPQPEDNLHYKGDYHNINKPVCTRDLLLWSFQVARGMEYLSTRKVLHGDLAARNILLTDGNVVKICDFGLSKSMYQNDVYRKKGDEMLPVKWMAIEAISDRIFSVQSDVWSFGVVLWEIFSLARTPYPGMEYNESFCKKLLDGYRMKCPQYATDEIYNIMLHCWNADPSKRPSFGQLVHSLGGILDDKIKEHYIDMNTGYLKMNAKKFGEQNADYLAMVGAPDFNKISSPCSYVNVAKSEDEVNTYI